MLIDQNSRSTSWTIGHGLS